MFRSAFIRLSCIGPPGRGSDGRGLDTDGRVRMRFCVFRALILAERGPRIGCVQPASLSCP
eukprot:scaffold102_cov340-Pavlova_lutheri.AAC.2